MMNTGNQLADDYLRGEFRFSPEIASHISEDRFHALRYQFSQKYDRFYHPYFKEKGDKVAANKALIRIAFSLFLETYGHLPLAYKNCAISSGTRAHLDAVVRNYHTTDRLSRVVGGDWHGRTIKDNSQRSLERVALIKDLMNEFFFVAPTMFEGSTRAFASGFGRQLTSIPPQAEEYMAFWNMVIDQCEGFVLDDVRIDMPSIERVEREIILAKAYSSQTREQDRLRTSDWVNSRNSTYEMGRGNYIRFGLHPLRPDAQMDMRIYDESTHSLYKAPLIDTFKPLVQAAVRWGTQGIWIDSVIEEAAAHIDLHRMRTDEVYNRRQAAPLLLEGLDTVIAKPTQKECHEMDRIIDTFEPIMLEYFAHLVKPEGLPEEYAKAKEKHPVKAHMKGADSVKWQRENIPMQKMLDLWELAMPDEVNPKKACKVKPVTHGVYIPPRRLHDFENQPFAKQDGEIWPDRPFDKLDPMFQQLAKAHIGVLEIVAHNNDAPEFNGLICDLKRGDAALDVAAQNGVFDLAHLPGALGNKFSKQVRQVNLEQAIQDLEDARQSKIGKKIKKVPAFGTPIIANINSVINAERKHFNGPGPLSVPTEYRLALMMEMLKRNLTTLKFSKNWEASEDECRLMMLATKIEFGKIERSAGNNTEIKILGKDSEYIPFAERIERIYTYLSRLKEDPKIKRAAETRDPSVLEGYGIRHISLTLARLIEIYDCMNDEQYNGCRFEKRRIENLREFSTEMENIAQIRRTALQELQSEWCWLWAEEDFSDLRQEYKDAWIRVHGRQAQNVGIDEHFDKGVRSRYGPQ
ncbi:MAG: hypothetical protein AUJ12_01620 [Alphaproteobacteria bacterium CG1_02_46_17]|nr:MAG: hypothetical protein AUJ12_01620 [Alphaproteobacteria bacterium CG1_02_46_17]